MEDIAISVENLTKIYKLYDKPIYRLKESLGLTRQVLSRDHYALRDISFQIKKGETVGIIGTNGSGKSTILKIITGVLNQTAGDVTVNGRISALLELGAGFNMEYTGIENVYMNGTMIGFSKEEIDSKLVDILEFADIGDFVNQPVKTYSSGMFVRLAFAVAINIDPEILIVDEALSVGDVFFQTKCYRKFEEFKKQGKTILFVSHDMGSIVRYCDRVIVLNKGKFVAEGESGKMVDLYKKILVNQFNPEDADEGSAMLDKSMDHSPQTKLEDGILKEGADSDTGASMDESHATAGTVSLGKTSDGLWKESLTINKTIDTYGNQKAQIVDFGVFDENENITNMIMKMRPFTVRMKVRVNEDVKNPIFAYTIKNKQNTDITGTNTFLEGNEIKLARKGEEYTITFRQDCLIQGGDYLLSLGCTGFENGEFVVYDRAYDCTSLTVISDKNTVGFVDLNVKVTVDKKTV